MLTFKHPICTHIICLCIITRWNHLIHFLGSEWNLIMEWGLSETSLPRSPNPGGQGRRWKVWRTPSIHNLANVGTIPTSFFFFFKKHFLLKPLGNNKAIRKVLIYIIPTSFVTFAETNKISRILPSEMSNSQTCGKMASKCTRSIIFRFPSLLRYILSDWSKG